MNTENIYHGTAKQLEIIGLIVQGENPASAFSPIDIDLLLERLSYKPSKQSLQFSIRALIQKGWIEKLYLGRRDRVRACFVPTETGKQMGVGLSSAAVKEFVEEVIS